jgi:hypothetical protein
MTFNGGLRRGLELVGFSSKSSPRLTHPTKYKILLSPQVRESQTRIIAGLKGKEQALITTTKG